MQISLSYEALELVVIKLARQNKLFLSKCKNKDINIYRQKKSYTWFDWYRYAYVI